MKFGGVKSLDLDPQFFYAVHHGILLLLGGVSVRGERFLAVRPIWSKLSGLSRPNLYLNPPYHWRLGGHGRFKV
jgi:hypothetical protein